MVRKGIPALERDRLLYVQQNYIRPDTISRANARLVDYQATIPLAQAWGGGEVASADGLRFVDVSSDYSKPSAKAPVIDPGDEAPFLVRRGEGRGARQTIGDKGSGGRVRSERPG